MTHEWISIKNKPPSYKDILVTDGIKSWVAQTYDNIDVFLACHPDYKRQPANEYGAPFITYAQPTHWMPLPKSPSDTLAPPDCQ